MDDETVVREIVETAVSRKGITKKDKSPNKASVKRSKASRKINRTKRRHKMTRKEKRSRSKK